MRAFPHLSRPFLLLLSLASALHAQDTPTKGRPVEGAVALVQRPKDGAVPLLECAFSGDGSTAVTRSEEGWVVFSRLGDHFAAAAAKAEAKKGEKVASDGEFRYGLTQMVLSPDGARLVAKISHDALAVVTRAGPDKPPRVKHQLRGMPGVGTWAIHPKGKELIASLGDGLVRSWDLETGRSTAYLPIQGTRHLWLGFAPDGVAFLALDVQQQVTMHEYPSGKKVKDVKLPHPVKTLVLRPDGGQFAYAFESAVHVWDADSLAPVKTIDTGSAPSQIAWTREGDRLAVGLAGGAVAVFDAKSGAQVHRFVPHPDKELIALQFLHPAKGRVVLATAAMGDDLVYWDLGKLLQPATSDKGGKRRPRK